MNILIDIGHPAHVHLFRNFYSEMKEKGHDVYVTVRQIPGAISLLEAYGIPYNCIGDKSDSLLMKAVNQLRYDLKLVSFIKSNDIKIGIGSSITLAHASRVTRMRSIIFDDDDDEVQPLMTRFGHPFADYLVSPSVLQGHRRRKDTIFYDGYHELAYLHPDRFTPDPAILNEEGLKMNEPYFILRFNAFKAHHDKSAKGLSKEQKQELIRYLEKRGRVIITSENETENDFSKYKMKVASIKMHSLIFFSSMLIGDSQTMTSEAAVMGVPSLRCNSFAGRISYLEEEEKRYGLTYGFRPREFNTMMSKLDMLLNTDNLKGIWQSKRARMIQEKIDVTKFMIDLTEQIAEKF